MTVPYNELAHIFLTIRTRIKLYHWQTRFYSRHKATDRFLETFEPLVDRFVEAAQGIAGTERVVSWCDLNSDQETDIQHSLSIINLNLSDETAFQFLNRVRNYIAKVKLPYSELAQIRDDMLEICDITLYLFTLE